MGNCDLCRPSLADSAPHGLWSLWDMLTLQAEEFISLLHSLIDTEAKTRKMAGQILGDARVRTDNAAKEMISLLNKLDLPVSIKTAEQMLVGCSDYEKLHRGIEQLTNTVMLELHGRRFYGPLRRYEQYFQQTLLFGEEVFRKFPGATDDIFEAGTCLALERGTACVMHLMRVVELGLKTLASALGIGSQNDWGSYLREIDRELTSSMKTPALQSWPGAAFVTARPWAQPCSRRERSCLVTTGIRSSAATNTELATAACRSISRRPSSKAWRRR